MVGGQESRLQHAWDLASRHWSVCAGTIAWPHASIEALKAAQ
jgi:hypothetical protein